jgi:hypothetical protein
MGIIQLEIISMNLNDLLLVFFGTPNYWGEVGELVMFLAGWIVPTVVSICPAGFLI